MSSHAYREFGDNRKILVHAFKMKSVKSVLMIE